MGVARSGESPAGGTGIPSGATHGATTWGDISHAKRRRITRIDHLSERERGCCSFQPTLVRFVAVSGTEVVAPFHLAVVRISYLQLGVTAAMVLIRILTPTSPRYPSRSRSQARSNKHDSRVLDWHRDISAETRRAA